MEEIEEKVRGSPTPASASSLAFKFNEDVIDEFTPKSYSYSKLKKKKKLARLISRSHKPYSFNFIQRGLPWFAWLSDGLYYQHALDLAWYKLLFCFIVIFIVFHMIFGLFYWISRGVVGLNHQGELSVENYLFCFYFSVQTMETIGYGELSPKSEIANLIVCFESYIGILLHGLLAGFVFAKVSRPSRLKRQVVWSNKAVINREEPVFNEQSQEYGESSEDCLIFRFMNTRNTQLVDSNLVLLALKKDKTIRINIDAADSSFSEQEEANYTLHELDFELNNQVGRVRKLDTSSPLLPLPWTVIHKMTKSSPLYGMDHEKLEAAHVEIIAVLDGVDESTSSNVQARWSYTPDDLIWQAKFVPMVRVGRWGSRAREKSFIVDQSKLNSIVYLEGENTYEETSSDFWSVDSTEFEGF